MVAEQLPKDEYFQYLSYQSCSFHILFYWYYILAVDKGTQLKSLLILGFYLGKLFFELVTTRDFIIIRN